MTLQMLLLFSAIFVANAKKISVIISELFLQYLFYIWIDSHWWFLVISVSQDKKWLLVLLFKVLKVNEVGFLLQYKNLDWNSTGSALV